MDKAMDRAAELGCTGVQTFASSPRTMQFSPVDQSVIDTYLYKRDEGAVTHHLFHGVYLINLAHVNREYVNVCVESLAYYQQLAGKINGMGTIFHIGSHKGLGLHHYLSQIAEAIVAVLEKTPSDVQLMLENAAGQNGVIGQSFEELAQVIEAVEKLGGDSNKLGIGVDTQHAWGSGYDFSTDAGVTRLVDDVAQTVGLERLNVLHVNDSKVALGSNRDRHANIGEGEIGEAGIARVINHPQLIHLPLFLEVPGDKQGPRPEDVDQLKRLANNNAPL
jgi:deoxyribonuclease-4